MTPAAQNLAPLRMRPPDPPAGAASLLARLAALHAGVASPVEPPAGVTPRPPCRATPPTSALRPRGRPGTPLASTVRVRGRLAGPPAGVASPLAAPGSVVPPHASMAKPPASSAPPLVRSAVPSAGAALPLAWPATLPNGGLRLRVRPATPCGGAVLSLRVLPLLAAACFGPAPSREPAKLSAVLATGKSQGPRMHAGMREPEMGGCAHAHVHGPAHAHVREPTHGSHACATRCFAARRVSTPAAALHSPAASVGARTTSHRAWRRDGPTRAASSVDTAGLRRLAIAPPSPQAADDAGLVATRYLAARLAPTASLAPSQHRWV
mmetsp:Transcript_5093/g.15484  ORF Transcript_5093/g.15484 Transcript_5093/m.15484 type:complete len:323 (-) Transcript_5093:85-1053(-)|eukprot:139102-Chlamydomonas_euryale.AAC.6